MIFHVYIYFLFSKNYWFIVWFLLQHITPLWSLVLRQRIRILFIQQVNLGLKGGFFFFFQMLNLGRGRTQPRSTRSMSLGGGIWFMLALIWIYYNVKLFLQVFCFFWMLSGYIWVCFFVKFMLELYIYIYLVNLLSGFSGFHVWCFSTLILVGMDYPDPKKKSSFVGKILLAAALTALCILMLKHSPSFNTPSPVTPLSYV